MDLNALIAAVTAICTPIINGMLLTFGKHRWNGFKRCAKTATESFMDGRRLFAGIAGESGLNILISHGLLEHFQHGSH
jgi:hypothetical protein